jgi:hypothetical protein
MTRTEAWCRGFAFGAKECLDALLPHVPDEAKKQAVDDWLAASLRGMSPPDDLDA